MQQNLEKVKILLSQFWEWKVIQIPQEQNAEIYALANLGMATDITETTQ